MADETGLQPDLFDDDFDRPRVFRCVGGAYIGIFNRQAVTPVNAAEVGEGAEPIQRLSAYLPSEDAAKAALAAGTWPAPKEP